MKGSFKESVLFAVFFGVAAVAETLGIIFSNAEPLSVTKIMLAVLFAFLSVSQIIVAVLYKKGEHFETVWFKKIALPFSTIVLLAVVYVYISVINALTVAEKGTAADMYDYIMLFVHASGAVCFAVAAVFRKLRQRAADMAARI